MADAPEEEEATGEEEAADTSDQLDGLEAEAAAEEEGGQDGEHIPAGGKTEEEHIDALAEKIKGALTSAGAFLVRIRGNHWAALADDTQEREDFCRDLAVVARDWLPEDVEQLQDLPPELHLVVSAAFLFGPPALVELGWLPAAAAGAGEEDGEG